MGVMNRIKHFEDSLNKNRVKKLLFSIPWVIGCLVVMLYLFKRGQFRYESNDDLFLSFIVNGIYGEYYKYNMFNSFPLSLLFSTLYSISRTVNWFFLYYYCFIVLSYIVFGVWNICRNRIIVAYLTSMLFVVSTYNALITRMNFSKSASIIIAVGYLLFVSSVDGEIYKRKWNIALRIVSYVFIIGGFLIRWDTCLASLPFLIVLIVYVFLNNNKQFKCIIPFIGIFVVLVVIWGSNYIAYNTDKDWKNWAEYNSVRAGLLDYYTGDYDGSEELYKEIGISRNDFEALDSWIYADDEVYDLDTMKKLAEIRDQSYAKYLKINKQNIESAILNSLDLFKYYLVIFVVIFLILMTIPLLKGKDSLVLISLFVLCFGEIFYLVFHQRCPERAFYLPIMVLFVMVIYFMAKAKGRNEWSIIFSIVCILTFIFYGSNFYTINRSEGFAYVDREETISMLKELSSREDKLYVWDGHERDILRYVFSPKDVPQFGLEKNFVMLGGWSVPSPIMSERAELFGEKYNYLRLLAYNGNVNYITKSDEYLGIIEQYIREHYNPDVKAELIETVNGFKIYSFV